jgi:hypothetical protein
MLCATPGSECLAFNHPLLFWPSLYTAESVNSNVDISQWGHGMTVPESWLGKESTCPRPGGHRQASCLPAGPFCPYEWSPWTRAWKPFRACLEHTSGDSPHVHPPWEGPGSILGFIGQLLLTQSLLSLFQHQPLLLGESSLTYLLAWWGSFSDFWPWVRRDKLLAEAKEARAGLPTTANRPMLIWKPQALASMQRAKFCGSYMLHPCVRS